MTQVLEASSLTQTTTVGPFSASEGDILKAWLGRVAILSDANEPISPARWTAEVFRQNDGAWVSVGLSTLSTGMRVEVPVNQASYKVVLTPVTPGSACEIRIDLLP
jgi:hypothetical protein